MCEQPLRFNQACDRLLANIYYAMHAIHLNMSKLDGWLENGVHSIHFHFDLPQRWRRKISFEIRLGKTYMQI